MQIMMGVENIIYIYGLVCLLMLLGNLVYLLVAQYQRRRNQKQLLEWQFTLAKQFSNLALNGQNDSRHERLLVRRLTKTYQLIAYSQALQTFLGANGKVQEYLACYQTAFQKIARIYIGKNNTKKAYFADFIAENPPQAQDGIARITEIFMEYLEHCDRFCRENVLRALSVLGSMRKVELLEEQMQPLGLAAAYAKACESEKKEEG